MVGMNGAKVVQEAKGLNICKYSFKLKSTHACCSFSRMCDIELSTKEQWSSKISLSFRAWQGCCCTDRLLPCRKPKPRVKSWAKTCFICSSDVAHLFPLNPASCSKYVWKCKWVCAHYFCQTQSSMTMQTYTLSSLYYPLTFSLVDFSWVAVTRDNCLLNFSAPFPCSFL